MERDVDGERFLRVVGYVQSDPDFYEIPQVMNAASDLFLEIFGENGAHARSAVGMASLPLNAAVEIEVTLQLLPLTHPAPRMRGAWRGGEERLS